MQNLVLEAGLEPARLTAGDFKSPVSTYSTTRAYIGPSGESRTHISRLSGATGYKSAVLPLNYRGLVLGRRMRIELMIAESQPAVLPLN